MPEPTARAWSIETLYLHPEAAALARRAGDRLLHLAAGLDDRETVELRLASEGDGTVNISMLALSRAVDLDAHVAWVWQDVGRVQPAGHPPRPRRFSAVTELIPEMRRGTGNVWAELDGAPTAALTSPGHASPAALPVGGLELLLALRESRAEIRLHVSPANGMASQMAEQDLRGSALLKEPLAYAAYLGTPVAARLLVGHDGRLSPRLRAALLARGIGLRLTALDADDPETRHTWNGDPVALCGSALPFGAAQCLTVIPAPGRAPQVCGVPVVHPPAEPVPIDDAVCREGLRLGVATSADGLAREVRLSVEDMLLHTQVIGSTGAGKSSLLAAIAHEAQRAGVGVSVIDPHGQLVDRILRETPPERAHSVVAVRSGDGKHPIPLNPLAGPDPQPPTEAMITVLRELHDPRNQGFMGPLWERWFAVLMELQRVLLGARANLALIPELAQDQKRLRALASSIAGTHPETARMLGSIVNRSAEDFAEVTTWVVSKFQRMIGSPQMLGILASGRDAVDVGEVMASRRSLLIDLAAPTIGDLSAQLLGEMWLAKHWEAMARNGVGRDTPHLLIVDEAHLFASGLLPRLLTQARKFGVGVVLAHQNLEQLTSNLREAVLSSTNNVMVFRTGIRESVAAHERLGAWGGSSLTRLERLTAAVSVNTGSGFTDAFTLRVDHNDRPVAGSSDIARRIEQRSKAVYGNADPEHARLTFASLVKAAERPGGRPAGAPKPPSGGESDAWLNDWLDKRRASNAGGSQQPKDRAS